MKAFIFATCLSIVFSLFGARCLAQDTAPATQPDKSRNTLLNPTPADQLRDMDTDRPNKTNTPHTIDAGHLQLEFGFFDYTYDRNKYHGANMRTDDLDLAQANFRIGITNNVEVNAIINPWDYQRNTDYTANQSTRQNGLGDTIVGGKINFWGNDGADDTWDTAFGVQPQFKIPTAREFLGNAHPELSVGFPFLLNLPADAHLALQTTVAWERSVAGTSYVAGWQNAASIDKVFFNLFDIYLEYWSHVSTERHIQAQQTADVGVVYQLNKNLAVDTGVNFGLNKSSDTFEWLSGISIRF